MIRFKKEPDLCDKVTSALFFVGGAAILIGAVGFILWGSVESFVYVMDAIKRTVWGR